MLIHDGNLPPQKWLTDRVVARHPGKDGKIRVADVQTSKAISSSHTKVSDVGQILKGDPFNAPGMLETNLYIIN